MRICCSILILALLALAGSVSAGIGLDSIPVSPPGDLVGGDTRVESSFTLTFIAMSGETSPQETLDLATGLADPKWSVTVFDEGGEKVWKTGTTTHLVLEGKDLIYPASGKIPVRINLTGTAPQVSETGRVEVVALTVIPGNNRLVESRTVVPGPGGGSGADSISGTVPAEEGEHPSGEVTLVADPGEAAEDRGGSTPGSSIFDQILSFFRNLFG